MKPQVLIIDDDKKICDLLKKLFSQEGFIALYSTSPLEAKQLLQYIKFDVLIVDYMMPVQNGINFIKAINEDKIDIPTLMLTAVDGINNRIEALSSGSNDYLSKPFNSQELVLRVRNLLKIKFNNDNNENIIVGDLCYNKWTAKLMVGNVLIELSSLEMDIFKIFIDNINNIIYKEEILKALGKPLTESNISTLSVNIMRLRKKLESGTKKYIKTIRGKGFILSYE